MTIATRSRARLYRPSEVEGELKSVRTVLGDTGRRVWLHLGAGTRGMRDFGAGEQGAATSPARVHALADVRQFDVLEIVAGPERGTAWKVLGVDRTDLSWAGLVLETFTDRLPS